MSLPTRRQGEPIVAWKTAGIRLTDHGAVFVPATHTTQTYGPVDIAWCHKGKHPVPDPDCQCGFYAMAHRDDVDWAGPLLEVELYGRVLKAEHGYRAEKQRVLAVHIADTCKCGRPSSGLIAVLDTIGFGCAECVAAETAELMAGPLPIEVASITLADVAARIGTEVRWSS